MCAVFERPGGGAKPSRAELSQVSDWLTARIIFFVTVDFRLFLFFIWKFLLWTSKPDETPRIPSCSAF